MDYAFGRLQEFDERSRKFAIRSVLRDRPRRSKIWRCNTFLNQGTEGACVGFSIAHEAAAAPVVVKGITNADGLKVYHMAQDLDEYDGSDYSGTSLLAGMKAGKKLKWYLEYRWAFGEDDLALAVGYAGPAVAGINWHKGMLTPDANGFIHPTGKVVGGHAILVRGYIASDDGYYILHNSWGKDWGISGECYLAHADMAKLLHDHGEAAVPVRNPRSGRE